MLNFPDPNQLTDGWHRPTLFSNGDWIEWCEYQGQQHVTRRYGVEHRPRLHESAGSAETDASIRAFLKEFMSSIDERHERWGREREALGLPLPPCWRER